MCKVVICGAGFLGIFKPDASQVWSHPYYTDTSLVITRPSHWQSLAELGRFKRVVFPGASVFRCPEKIWEALHSEIASLVPHNHLLPPVPVDITRPSTIKEAFKDASVVVSLVGIMHGALQDFERIQWVGAENVAIAARDAGAKIIHFSAIGADPESSIPYVRTKGLGEQSVLAIDPTATIIRPSLVFGPEDDFFNVCSDFLL